MENNVQEIKNNSYQLFISLIFTNPNKLEELQPFIYVLSELESIPYKVSESLLILLRLNWWREALRNYKSKQETPLIEQLKTLLDSLYFENLKLENLVNIYDIYYDQKSYNIFEITEGFNIYFQIFERLYKPIDSNIKSIFVKCWVYENTGQQIDHAQYIESLETLKTYFKKNKICFLTNLVITKLHLANGYSFKSNKLRLFFKLLISRLF